MITLGEFVKLCNELRDDLDIPEELIAPVSPERLSDLGNLELLSESVQLLFSFPTDNRYLAYQEHAKNIGHGFLNYSIDSNHFSYCLGTLFALGSQRLVVDFAYATESMSRYNCICLVTQMARVSDTPVFVVSQDIDKATNSFLGLFAQNSGGIHTLEGFYDSIGNPRSNRYKLHEFSLPFTVTVAGEVVFESVVTDWIGRADRIFWLRNMIQNKIQHLGLKVEPNTRHHATICEDKNPRIISLSTRDKQTKILWSE